MIYEIFKYPYMSQIHNCILNRYSQMKILIVGGTDRTMENHWNHVSKRNNYHLQFDSSNIFDNYGRNKFGPFHLLGNRSKHLYDMLIFEYCPLSSMINCAGDVEKFVDQIRFVTRDYHNVIFPINSKDEVYWENNKVTLIDCDSDYITDEDDSYCKNLENICNAMIYQNYNIDIISKDNLLPEFDMKFNRFETCDTKFVILKNN